MKYLSVAADDEDDEKEDVDLFHGSASEDVCGDGADVKQPAEQQDGEEVLGPLDHAADSLASAVERSTYTRAVQAFGLLDEAMRIPQIASAQRDASTRGSKRSTTRKDMPQR